MTVVVVHASGFDSIFAVIGRLETAQWDRLLRLIGMRVQEQTINHFQQQAGPDGAWAPTKRGGHILVKTGHLRGSIHHVVAGDEVRIGTPVGYGKFHQLGTSRMPARAFLGLTESDKGELEHIINDFVEGVMAS